MGDQAAHELLASHGIYVDQWPTGKHKRPGRGDVVLITHAHADHLPYTDLVTDRPRSRPKTVLCSPITAKLMVARGAHPSRFNPILVPGSVHHIGRDQIQTHIVASTHSPGAVSLYFETLDVFWLGDSPVPAGEWYDRMASAAHVVCDTDPILIPSGMDWPDTAQSAVNIKACLDRLRRAVPDHPLHIVAHTDVVPYVLDTYSIPYRLPPHGHPLRPPPHITAGGSAGTGEHKHEDPGLPMLISKPTVETAHHLAPHAHVIIPSMLWYATNKHPPVEVMDATVPWQDHAPTTRVWRIFLSTHTQSAHFRRFCRGKRGPGAGGGGGGGARQW